MQYRFFQDPGHGWLEVPRGELDALNLSSRVSQYSYQNDGNVYLEEDCDAPLFFAEKARRDERVDVVQIYHEDSPIVRFDRYQRRNS